MQSSFPPFLPRFPPVRGMLVFSLVAGLFSMEGFYSSNEMVIRELNIQQKKKQEKNLKLLTLVGRKVIGLIVGHAVSSLFFMCTA